MPDKMVSPLFEREPENAPGPFYVVKDQCITCSLPVETAPETIRYHETPSERCPEGCADHCYVSRQPETPEEVDRMIEVVADSCISAYRYCGSNEQHSNSNSSGFLHSRTSHRARPNRSDRQ
jgi:hypothetical protein